MLYALVELNLISTIRLTKKNIEVHLRGLNKLSYILINNSIIRYTNIKEDLYYLRITNLTNLVYRLSISLILEDLNISLIIYYTIKSNK